MTERDFRYTMPDGSEVEAFQITPRTRYQEREWPPWMNSKWLMTVDKEEWLNINDVETPIPKFGWIVKLPNGTVTVKSWDQMEHADKFVKEQPVVHPPAEVDEVALLQLASRLTGKSVEELEQEQLREGRTARKPPPEPAMAAPEKTVTIRDEDTYLTVSPEPATDLIEELVDVYSSLADGEDVTARTKLRNILAQRVTWCNCPPGQCAGSDRLGCRVHSPLAQ